MDRIRGTTQSMVRTIHVRQVGHRLFDAMMTTLMRCIRIICQVATKFRAPHAVEEPDASYRLPIDDIFCYNPKTPVPGNSYPSLSTPVEIPLCYFAREIQASRILGQVQMLRRLSDAVWLYEQFAVVDRKLMRFMKILFEQTPGSWAVLCGANAICLACVLSYAPTMSGH